MQDELPLVSPQTIGFCDSPWKDKARMWAELLCELLRGAYPLPKRLHGIGRDSLSPFDVVSGLQCNHSSQRGSYVVGYGVTLLHFQYIFNLKCFFSQNVFWSLFSFRQLLPEPPYLPTDPISYSYSLPFLCLSVSLSPSFPFALPLSLSQNIKKITWNTNENHNKHTKRKKTNKQ